MLYVWVGQMSNVCVAFSLPPSSKQVTQFLGLYYYKHWLLLPRYSCVCCLRPSTLLSQLLLLAVLLVSRKIVAYQNAITRGSVSLIGLRWNTRIFRVRVRVKITFVIIVTHVIFTGTLSVCWDIHIRHVRFTSRWLIVLVLRLIVGWRCHPSCPIKWLYTLSRSCSVDS